MERPGGVVDEEFALGEFGGGGGEGGEVALVEEAVADVAEVHAGAGAEHALDELGGAHFEGEDGDGALFLEGDVLGHVHGKRGFAHGGARGDDDHLGGVESVGHFVELGEAGGQAGDRAAPFIQLLDGVDGLHDLVLHAGGLVLEAVLRDGEYFALHVVEEVGDVVLLVVAARGVFGADLDDLAQGVLFLHDLHVVGEVRRRGEKGE